MKGKIVRIGNSRGIRIPKHLLEQTGIDGDVEIVAEGRQIVIRPLRPPRAGWEEALREMASRGEDRLEDWQDMDPSRWETDEWEWK